MELNPNYAFAHVVRGSVFAWIGRSDDAITEEKRALELDPFSVVANRMLGFAFYSAGRYDESVEQELVTLQMDRTYWHLGIAYLRKSMPTEAISQCKDGLAIFPEDPYLLSTLGYAYAATGRREGARKVLDQLKSLSDQKYVPAWSMAAIHAGLDEKDRAFLLLDKAYEEGSWKQFGRPSGLWNPTTNFRFRLRISGAILHTHTPTLRANATTHAAT